MIVIRFGLYNFIRNELNSKNQHFRNLNLLHSSINCLRFFSIRTDAELFVGFKPAIEACYLDWEEYPIAGITHTQETNPIYYSPFTCFKHTELKSETNSGQVNATQAVMASNKHYNYISSSTDHGMHLYKQRYDRTLRDRFYISSSNNSSNSSSDSVNARINALGGLGASLGNPALSSRSTMTDNSGNIGSLVGAVGGGSVSVGISPAVDLPRRVAAMGGNLGGDGNRSSASSEGFCENDDFGGDSSSNNLCAENARALEPPAASSSAKKLVSKSDSLGSFVDSSASLEASADGSTENLKLPDTSSTAIVNALPGQLPIYQTTASVSSDTSSSSSNSSSSSMLITSGGVDIATEVNVIGTSGSVIENRRISKDESSSSCDECGTQDSTAGAPSAVDATSAARGLQAMPSTSAAALGTLLKKSANELSPSGSNIKQQYACVNACSHAQPSTSAAATAALAASNSSVTAATAAPFSNTASNEKPHIFSNVRPTEDAWDILLARAEGLHAHGHGKEACILAVRLAEEMLANPPNLMLELPPPPKRKGKNKNINPISHHLTVLASSTLSKCAFLCTVLSENLEHSHIGFRICLFALEMPRPPASTKPLEVKLANQEADILALLKKIPLNQPELQVIRERAEQLKNGTFKTRGEALLPINLVSFIFDALVMPSVTGREQRNRIMAMCYRMSTDENLGFEAAVAALGLKANVSEAEHPLLCEGTRRQRGDLALTLLYYYKDEPRKIAKIMEKLLDRDIHILLKTPLLPSYYSNNPPVRTPASQVSLRNIVTLL